MTSGILNVAKPVGITSFAVVRAVGRLPGVRKVGHGGTLDPAAEGVLPVLIDAATRLADFVHLWPKTYLATIRLGASSDTDDREGSIRQGGDTSGITADQIESTLAGFSGPIEQVPPMHSALKIGGEALYRKARRGESIVRGARPVMVHSIRLLDYNPEQASLRLEVVSGKGFYVRSLARDLGERLACGAYLAALTRTAYGPLLLSEAVAPGILAEAGDGWARWLLPMDLPLRGWPALHLDGPGAAAIEQGRSILDAAVPQGQVRLLDPAGALLGWGTVDAGHRVQPRAVFPR